MLGGKNSWGKFDMKNFNQLNPMKNSHCKQCEILNLEFFRQCTERLCQYKFEQNQYLTAMKFFILGLEFFYASYLYHIM